MFRNKHQPCCLFCMTCCFGVYACNIAWPHRLWMPHVGLQPRQMQFLIFKVGVKHRCIAAVSIKVYSCLQIDSATDHMSSHRSNTAAHAIACNAFSLQAGATDNTGRRGEDGGSSQSALKAGTCAVWTAASGDRNQWRALPGHSGRGMLTTQIFEHWKIPVL